MEPSLEDLLNRYRLSRPEQLLIQFSRYLELLQKWNRRISLTACADWREMRPFFEEGMWSSCFYPDGPVRHLDLGSGAGFPAILIRIIKERSLLDLVERRTRPAVFLQTVARELGLAGTKVHNQDVESFLSARKKEEPWDIVSSKGVRWSPAEISVLGGHARQVWIFHGAGIPKRIGLREELVLYRREECPSRAGWYLSVFQSPG